MSELASREALDWKKKSAQNSLEVLFNLLAKRVDEILADSSMKAQIVHEIKDLKIKAQEVVERYGSR